MKLLTLSLSDAPTWATVCPSLYRSVMLAWYCDWFQTGGNSLREIDAVNVDVAVFFVRAESQRLIVSY